MPLRIAVLDMAGTTVEDDGLVLECFVACCAATGVAATSEEINARMGQAKLEVFEWLTTRQLGPGHAAEELRDRAYADFRRRLEDAYARGGAKPAPRATEVLEWLRAHDIRVALNTGFYRAVTDILVNALGWRNKVDAIVCTDDVRQGRPAPYMIFRAMELCGVTAVGEVLVAGDTPSDLRAGSNACAAAVVGVTSGAHSARTLRREPHTHLIGGIAELPGLVQRVGRVARFG